MQKRFNWVKVKAAVLNLWIFTAERNLMAVVEDQGGWWGGLTGNLTPSLTSCPPPTDTLCCFQLFLETWHFWQPSKKVEMRFFSKQEKQNTFILLIQRPTTFVSSKDSTMIHRKPNSQKTARMRWRYKYKRTRSDGRVWVFLLLVDAPSSLSAVYLCSLLSSSLSGGVETEWRLQGPLRGRHSEPHRCVLQGQLFSASSRCFVREETRAERSFRVWAELKSSAARQHF